MRIWHHRTFVNKAMAHAVRCCAEALESRTLLAGLSIAAENQLPGSPASEWDVDGAGDSTLQGFATDISVNQGQTVTFKIDDQDRASYHIDIYRMGYYGGLGARKVTTIGSFRTDPQPAPITDSETQLVDCGNWLPSASWHVPSDATSGIYFAKLVRDDTGGASHIYFIVRNDTDHSAVLFKTSDTTWQAYNDWGGAFIEAPSGRAYKASYNRPFNTRAHDDGYGSWNFVFHAEYPMVRWLESNGYDVSYFTSVDADRYGSMIQDHRVFLSLGHDEYWSGQERASVEAARDAGVNLAFFSGNESYRKIRWETSIDNSGTPYRTMVCYKESNADAPIDPADPPIWTGCWRDPRFSPPADGGRPENALSGQLFTVCVGANELGTAFKVPSTYSKLRFWRNTSVASLTTGQTATLGDHVLGYEWDEDVDNGFRPAGLFDMSSTSTAVQGRLIGDNIAIGADVYPGGSATHTLTLYRAASGAMVFGAGTVQWSWGLDGQHDNGSYAPDRNVQQATVNLLADMGVQPATLQSGLVKATASTDSTRPTSTITSPANGATFQPDTPITVTGTASDGGGGVVAAVEISVDGGSTWHPLTGRATWSYTWTPHQGGTITIKSRAVDDSGNLETPSAGVTLTTNGGQTPSGTSIWSDTAVPAVASDSDASSVELGVKFRSDVAGSIRGIRFYKGSQNTGTHVGSLWSQTGTLLARATFTNETSSGWQSVLFSTPVTIAANTTYVASYHAGSGHYSVDEGYFAVSGIDSSPLHALGDGDDGPNGVYRYGSTSVFPTDSYQSSNYWVDILFATGADTQAPTVTGRSPSSGATNVPVTTTVSATFSEPVQSSSILFVLRDAANNSVPATLAYDSVSNKTTLTPTTALAGSSTYTATVSGAKDSAGNTMAGSVSWSFTTIAVDTTPPTVTGQTPALNATNVPVNTTVTVTFSEAVDSTTVTPTNYQLKNGSTVITASVTYNSSTRVATLIPSTPLAGSTTYTAAIAGVKDLAGNTLSGTVSWSFTTVVVDNTAPTVTAQTPAFNATNVPATTKVTVTFSEAVDSTTVNATNFQLKNGTTVVPATVTYDTTTHIATLTPTSALASLTQYTVSISGVKDLAGNAMTDPVTWSFTTAAVDTTPPSVTTQTPAASAMNVPVATTVTVTFDEAVDAATVTGANFQLTNGSTTMSASVSYNATTRTATLTPTAVLSGSTTYIAMVSDVKDLAGNAMTGSVSWSFTTVAVDTTPPTVTGQTPAANATGIAIATSMTATFSESVQPASISFVLRDSKGTAVLANVAYSDSTRTATLTPSNPLAYSTTYTATLSGASDLAGNVMTGLVGWSFTTVAAPAQSTFSLWSNTTIPAIAADPDSAAVELGVKFRASIAGYITGIRFYKGSTNTGTHTGSLWNRSGTRLATVTFANESSSGWQTASFASPVLISANTTYIASYHTNSGHYAVDEEYFVDAGVDSGPLHALSDGEDGPNGLYRYGSTSAFPNSAYNSSNYWCDVVFSPASADTVAPTVASYSPASGATGVSIATAVNAAFSESVQPSSISFVLRDAGGNAVSAAVTYTDATKTVTLTPTSPLVGSATYTATITGALDLAGNSLASPATWSFTTAGAGRWTQTSASDFATGSAAGVLVVDNAGGELQLAPACADEFNDNALGSSWSTSVWSSGTGTAAATETGDILSIGRMQVLSAETLTDTAIEGRIAFAAARGQQFGLATSLLTTSGNYSAVFTTKSTSTTLYARVNNAGTLRDVNLGAIPTGFHVYRVEPIATGFRFYIDGVLETAIARTLADDTGLKVAFAAQNGTPVLQVDWVYATAYASTGTFVSSVFDAGRSVNWQSAAWSADLPAGTSLSVEISTGNTANPDGTWSAWTAIGNGSPIAGQVARYLRYRLQLTTTDSAETPTLFDISFAWN